MNFVNGDVMIVTPKVNLNKLFFFLFHVKNKHSISFLFQLQYMGSPILEG